jgi:hypothetical protein
MKRLLTDCSIKPIGSRGFLSPTVRKNPRFPSGTKFSVKTQTINHLLVKLDGCNSVFAISKDDAIQILGVTLEDYKNILDQKRLDGLKVLAKVMSEIYKEEATNEES